MPKRTRRAPFTQVYLLRFSLVERDQTPEWLISLETPGGERRNLATLEHLMNFLEQELAKTALPPQSLQDPSIPV